MIEICEHVLHGGRKCPQPAVRGAVFCRHHGGVVKAMERARRPVAYGSNEPIEFVFPEDRAAIQLNLALVLEALNQRRSIRRRRIR